MTLRHMLFQHADYESIEELERSDYPLYRELCAQYWREAPIDLATEVMREGDAEVLSAFEKGDSAELGRIIATRLADLPRDWLGSMLREEQSSIEADAEDYRREAMKDRELERRAISRELSSFCRDLLTGR